MLGIMVLSLSMFALSGCRSVTVKSGSYIDEKKTTEEKSTKDTSDDDKDYIYDDGEDDEEKETTTKKNNSSSKTDWKSYSGTNYSFKLSSDWTKTTNASAELAFSHLGTASDGFAENINVIVQDLSSYDIDLEGYKDLSLQQFEDLGYELESIKSMKVNGVKGYYCVTSVYESGIECYMAQYFTVIDDSAYIFTFAADEDGFDELEDEVIDIYNTIEFKSVSGA